MIKKTDSIIREKYTVYGVLPTVITNRLNVRIWFWKSNWDLDMEYPVQEFQQNCLLISRKPWVKIVRGKIHSELLVI